MRTVAAILVAGVSIAATQRTAYEQEIDKWRKAHEAELKADDGWLTVVGLYWLKEGSNRAGQNPNWEVIMPSPMPWTTGIFLLKNDVVHFKPGPNAKLKETDMKPDTEKDYTVMSLGSVRFHVIKRADKFAVRVKDNNSPARKNFKGLKWYPVDPTWKVRAKFVQWDKPRTLTFETEVGVKEEESSPGYVSFRRNDKEYRLQPVKEGDSLFFVMKDQTSGKTTYGASRFLYADPPKNGIVELDFNKAENPPCVFTDYATCPLPPPQNRLALPITAGEMMYQH
jgi:uncharacterized protein